MHSFREVAVNRVYRTEIVQGLLHTNTLGGEPMETVTEKPKEGCDETTQDGKFYLRMKTGHFLVFT